ncbi:hypothetical protein V498_01631 [Pseudogymnoascus sp. VKM F-4517 (FW-2822)]|nr:hypothetical protein V498_01631 [Pseudogymnoascus sp. VKM F-4517 (FW-2822)]
MAVYPCPAKEEWAASDSRLDFVAISIVFCAENKYDGKAEDHVIPGAQSSPMSDDTAPCKKASGSITRDIASKAANSRALIRPAEKIVAGLHHATAQSFLLLALTEVLGLETNVGFETLASLMASARPVSETKTLRVAWLPIKRLHFLPPNGDMAAIFQRTAHLLTRQASAQVEDPLAGTPGHCDTGNEFDGRLGLRISAIFVILVGSAFEYPGVCFPIFARRHAGTGVPDWLFFAVKYFGSGVIIATAFIHLLAPANEALTDPCLTGPITEYTWVEGIALMTIMVMFFVELLTMRYANSREAGSHQLGSSLVQAAAGGRVNDSDCANEARKLSTTDGEPNNQAPGADHFGHKRNHPDNWDVERDWQKQSLVPESYAAQLTAISILEFGVIFHSVLIGLTLSVAGEEFKTLYIVLVFHQTFEGLGLGARLSTVPWPGGRSATPYLLGLGYAISTPLAIAIGLGVRNSYRPGSQTTLIVNGVLDSISAGILLYTGLVELMAHEFIFSTHMRKAPIRVILLAFGSMCLGAGLMAVLGKWA